MARTPKKLETTDERSVATEGRKGAEPPAKSSETVRVTVKKTGALGTFLRPIGIVVALLLAGYGLVSIGSTFWRSYQRHAEYTSPTHADRSIFDILVRKQVKDDEVALLIRDVDGKLRRVVAEKSGRDKFVNSTILHLEDERAALKAAADADMDRLFAYAFADREQSINNYADWFFEWKRSYVVLKETIASTVNRLIETGEYESLSEAVERDVKDYLMRHFRDQVLKPDLRDERVSDGLEMLVRRAHENYKRVIANSDMRLQLFLNRETRHLETIPANQKLTEVKLDWDAQKWKAPTYLMEDAAFSGIVGLGTVAAGGTFGRIAGPAVGRATARVFGMLSSRFAASVATRIALAEKGAVAGTFVHPAGGQVIGALAGVVIGIAADYFINRANEEFNRDKFIDANNEALDATIQTWRGGLKASVDAAIDRWFDDARSSVVLARN